MRTRKPLYQAEPRATKPCYVGVSAVSSTLTNNFPKARIGVTNYISLEQSHTQQRGYRDARQ